MKGYEAKIHQLEQEIENMKLAFAEQFDYLEGFKRKEIIENNQHKDNVINSLHLKIKQETDAMNQELIRRNH